MAKPAKQAQQVILATLGHKARMDLRVYKDSSVLLGPWAIRATLVQLAELAQRVPKALLVKPAELVEPVLQDGEAELDKPAQPAQQETREIRALPVPQAELELLVLEVTPATRATRASLAHPAHLVQEVHPEQLVPLVTLAKPVEPDPPEQEDKPAPLATRAIRVIRATPVERVERVFSVILATRVQPAPTEHLVPMVVVAHAVFSAPPAQIPTRKSDPLDKVSSVMRPSFMAPVAPMSITPCSAEATSHMPTIIISSCPRHPPTE